MREWLLTFYILTFALIIQAQENIPTTETIYIEGAVKKSKEIKISELLTHKQEYLDSLPIYNHKMEYKKTLKKLKTVLLKDILESVEFDVPGAKWLGEFYIVCVASDNYKVVFSWNEIFNSDIGKKLAVIVEENGKPIQQSEDRISLISPSDYATGRRYVKGLSKIIIKRAG
jgi:uncharacterized protein YbaA (DUF1428 family)